MRLYELKQEYDEISEDILDDIVKNHNVAIKKYRSGYPIYKGISKYFATQKIDPKKYPRKSAHTNNYYTLMIDNFPEWEKYPKRSQSLICTSDVTNSRNRGDSYIVLPENGSKLGICSDEDIWESFNEINEKMGVHNMNGFNKEIGNILGYFSEGLPSNERIQKSFNEIMDNSSFENFKENIKIIDNIIENNKDDMQLFEELLLSNNLFRYAIDNNISIMKSFKNLLNPDKNGFGLETIENYDIPLTINREVWTDGTSYLVHEDNILKVLKYYHQNKER